jgi:hypothetical protein
MKLELQVSDVLLKKLKILNILMEGGEDVDFIELLTSQVEGSIEGMIRLHLDALSSKSPGPSMHVELGASIAKGAAVLQRTPTFRHTYDQTPVDVAEGLSNEDFELDEDEHDEAIYNEPVFTDPTPVKKAAPAKKKPVKAKVQKVAPAVAAVTAESLLMDDEVDDPEHEAVSPTDSDTTFEDLMGVSSKPSEDDRPTFTIPELDDLPPVGARSNPRRLPKYCKANVDNLTGVPRD